MACTVHHTQQVARAFRAKYIKITTHHIAGPSQHKLLWAQQMCQLLAWQGGLLD